MILKINGRGYYIDKKSNNKEAKGRYAENLHLFGQSALTTIHARGGTTLLMECLPEVAKYYEVDKNKLLQAWLDEVATFLPSLDLLKKNIKQKMKKINA